MNNTKFNFFIFIIFLVLAGIIYWSVSTIDTGVYYNNTKEEESNEELENIELPLNEINLEIETEEELNKESKKINPEYSELIKKLEKLISDNIYMKKGSQGTRVGIIQKFLNIYNDTKSIIDNDYGNKTVDLIKKFQKDQGLGVDGQAGLNTYKEMIGWLKEN